MTLLIGEYLAYVEGVGRQQLCKQALLCRLSSPMHDTYGSWNACYAVQRIHLLIASIARAGEGEITRCAAL